MGDAESSLGDAKRSLSDAKSSLGDAESSLGDAESSLGDIQPPSPPSPPLQPPSSPSHLSFLSDRPSFVVIMSGAAGLAALVAALLGCRRLRSTNTNTDAASASASTPKTSPRGHRGACAPDLYGTADGASQREIGNVGLPAPPEVRGPAQH
jgi:hypothetical protein